MWNWTFQFSSFSGRVAGVSTMEYHRKVPVCGCSPWNNNGFMARSGAICAVVRMHDAPIACIGKGEALYASGSRIVRAREFVPSIPRAMHPSKDSPDSQKTRTPSSVFCMSVTCWSQMICSSIPCTIRFRRTSRLIRMRSVGGISHLMVAVLRSRNRNVPSSSLANSGSTWEAIISS